MSLLSKFIINLLTKEQLDGVSGVTAAKKDLYFGSDDQIYLTPYKQEAPNIGIGTVSSGASPAVTVAETDDKAILNFVLQKGADGISAYEAAKSAGYTGTEAELNAALAAVPTYSPFVVASTAPTDLSKLWIDSANSNVLKFYNGTEWTTIGSVYS